MDLNSFSGMKQRPPSILCAILNILLLLMDAAKADKLYPQQGVLLVQTEGFVITADTPVNVVYTDGISGSDQIQDCDGNSIDLSTVRNRFYTMAVQELNANGFNFITAKQPDPNTGEKPPQQLMYYPKTTEKPTMIHITPGDEEEAIPLVAEEQTSDCGCDLVRDDEVKECTCVTLKAKVYRTLFAPEPLTQAVYITVQYNNVLPLDNAHFINHKDKYVLVYLQSPKGTISYSFSSPSNITAIDVMTEPKYMYLVLEVTEMEQIKVSFDIHGDYCPNPDECDSFEFGIALSWEEYFRRTRHVRTPGRQRRSMFFGLQTQDEVNSIINGAMKVSEGWANQNKNNIAKLSALLERSDLAVSNQSNQLKSLYRDICAMNSQATVNNNMIKIEASITENLKVLLELLTDCSVGHVPNLFSYRYIREICLGSMDLEMCDKFAHKIRTLMTCAVKEVHLLDTKYVIQFSLPVPESFKEKYDLFQIVTIPVFSGPYHHQIRKVDGLTLLQYEDRKETVLLTDCTERYDILVCSATQSADHIAATCIADVVLGTNTTKCWTESYRDTADCYVKPFSHGLLISTARVLEVHHHHMDRVFNSKSSTINGTTILSNDPKQSLSVACNGILVSTRLTDPKPLQLQPQPHFDWNTSVRASLDTELRDQISRDQQSSRRILTDLNTTMNDMSHGFKFEHINLDGPHRYTVVSFIILGTLIALVILFCLICYCCPCCQCFSCMTECCCCPTGQTTTYIPNWQLRMPNIPRRRPRRNLETGLSTTSDRPFVSRSTSGGSDSIFNVKWPTMNSRV